MAKSLSILKELELIAKDEKIKLFSSQEKLFMAVIVIKVFPLTTKRVKTWCSNWGPGITGGTWRVFSGTRGKKNISVDVCQVIESTALQGHWAPEAQ